MKRTTTNKQKMRVSLVFFFFLLKNTRSQGIQQNDTRHSSRSPMTSRLNVVGHGICVAEEEHRSFNKFTEVLTIFSWR